MVLCPVDSVKRRKPLNCLTYCEPLLQVFCTQKVRDDNALGLNQLNAYYQENQLLRKEVAALQGEKAQDEREDFDSDYDPTKQKGPGTRTRPGGKATVRKEGKQEKTVAGKGKGKEPEA